MSIVDFLRKKLGQNETIDPQMQEYSNRRYHARYMINDRDLFTVEHSQYGIFRVVDVSYHGCLAEPVADANLESATFPIIIDLSACGLPIRLEAQQAQRRKNGWALIFKHVNESSIRSISSYIEPLRCGSSMIVLPADPAKDGAATKLRKRYQGDGPFDLLIERDEKSAICFLMGTIRRGREYGSVIWNKGEIVTKKSLDETGDGARMSQTQEIDWGLVWHCAVACLGAKFPDGAQCAKLLNDALLSNAKVALKRTS